MGVLTRWRQAHSMLLDSEEWHDDEELRKLPTLDILLAFEDYSRVREREFEEQTRSSQVEKTRKERKAREAFKVMRIFKPCYISVCNNIIHIGTAQWSRRIERNQSSMQMEARLSSIQG